MKKTALLLILTTLIVSNVIASNIEQRLSKTKVTHLELLANNLNILFWLNKINNKKEHEKKKTKDNAIEEVLVKFSTSKNHRLVIENFYIGPVQEMTDSVCKKQLDEVLEKMSNGNSKVSSITSMLHPIRLTPVEVQKLFDNAYITVYMNAKENSQLGIKCQK